MKKVYVHYGVVFGKCDSTDWIDYLFELTDEEGKLYDESIKNGIPLRNIPELQEALDRAYAEIEEMEIQNGLDCEEEYVMECQGVAPVDPDEINDLIADRDEHAIAFFGLEDLSEDELEEWDANDLDDLPLIEEFYEDFEPYSPYDEGWTLNVEFIDPNEKY